MNEDITIFWFRRDLRFADNKGLFEALKMNKNVLLIFIFDTDILIKLPKNDARITFIHQRISIMSSRLHQDHGSIIAQYYGQPIAVFKTLVSRYNIKSVYANHDYEPYAKRRDSEIMSFLSTHDITFNTFKDQVIFEKNEIVKKDGLPYVVYSPYMRKWKTYFSVTNLTQYPSESLLENTFTHNNLPQLSLEDIGFTKSDQNIAPYTVTPQLIASYEATRNYPSKDATSRLGPYLRFGTVSIREIVKKAICEKNEVFWQELIWREFFMQILWHFPHTKDRAFRSKYDRIEWRNNEDEFQLWCDGKTGYPLVDAGMRELNATGFMHNRVRMLVSSFLCKHLLIDWRWGEAYFAERLHDYEMASNIGNWQWAAGSGVDAAPYFRIFNPTSQILKFDKAHQYIKKWVPEYMEFNYPRPMVDHKFARERCLKIYKTALN